MITDAYKKIEVFNAGGTDSIEIDKQYPAYHVYTTGPVTLLAAYTIAIAAGPTPLEGMRTKVYVTGDINFNGSPFTIAGKVVPTSFSQKQFTADVLYINGSWEVNLQADFEETEMIEGDRIKPNTIADDRIIDLDGAKILQNTIPSTALETSVNVLNFTEVFIDSTTLGNAFSVPVTLVPSIPGCIIYPVSVTVFINGGTSNWTGPNTVGAVKINAAVENVYELDFLGVPIGTNPSYDMPKAPISPGAGVSQLVGSRALEFTVNGGNPSGGNRDVTVYVWWTTFVC